jgi:osmoprotectant transport system ATP-binding protein
LLELLDVQKSFGPVRVLDRVSLAVGPGRTTVLLGPSGGGKSTLLRAMIGLVQPDAGVVLFNGTAVTSRNIRELRHHMGYVVQDGGLFPHLSATKNITLMARQLGWETRRIRDRLATLSDLTRMPAELLQRYPAELSGGQRQRISLMRALMLDPDVLLLDEPLGALDPITRAELQADLREIFQRLHKTVVLVTHDLAEAAFFADEIVLLAEGQIVQRGSMRELVDRPATPFVARFVQAQRAPMEMLREAMA